MRPAAGLALLLLALAGKPAVPAAAQTAPPGQAEHISRIERGLLPPIVIRGRPLPLSSIEEQMRQLRVPGVSVAVIRDGSIAWAKGYGTASERERRRVTKDTLFEAGSISKGVTAVAALRLVAEGKLTLDGNVEGELKSWKIPENKFTRQHPVTLRELLSHTAGMTVHGFPGYRRDGPIPSLAQVLDGVKPQVNTDPVRVDAVPGTLWRYSGGGYAVVQQLLIDTAGESFPELMRRQVLAPLHMAESTFEQPLPKRFWGRAASGYRADGSAVPGGWHVYPEMAAAGLWTTATDLARYVIAIQAAAAGRSGGVLSPEMARAMQTPVMRGYGFGLQVRGEGPTLRFFHGGVDDGFDSYFVALESGDGIVILTNSNNGLRLAAEIVNAAAREYGWAGLGPREKKLAAVDPKVLARYAGIYQAAPNFFLMVTDDGGRLDLATNRDPQKRRLWPESETRYFVIDLDVDLQFVENSGGQVLGLIASDPNGEPVRARKLQ